jgi:molecular chaperone Hsp33
MADKLVRGNSMDGAIRVFAAVTTDLVNEAQRIHHTYPVATAALGRLLTGAAIMGAAGLKNETDSMTVQIKGEGEITNLVAVTDCHSRVRGYVSNPYVDRPLNNKGKLDVGGAIGGGYLSVVRDLGLKEPYVGQIPLVSGEIAEDLTYYYAKSEQIPTSVALGVLVDTDNSVIAAGGFMIQLMPEATEEMAVQLEDILKELPPVTTIPAHFESWICELFASCSIVALARLPMLYPKFTIASFRRITSLITDALAQSTPARYERGF